MLNIGAGQGATETPAFPGMRGLTKRECEIAALIARGYSNQEVAAALNIREQTVKNRLTGIFEKLQIRGRVRLAVFAIEHGLT